MSVEVNNSFPVYCLNNQFMFIEFRSVMVLKGTQYIPVFLFDMCNLKICSFVW